MEKTIVYLDEMEAGVRQAVERLDNRSERRAMAFHVFYFATFLDYVQSIRMLVRLQYFRAAFHVFNYLRRNKQLGRRVGKFDWDVKREIVRVLLAIYNENNVDNGENKN